jgi:predicted O-methyltransferase YrrM
MTPRPVRAVQRLVSPALAPIAARRLRRAAAADRSLEAILDLAYSFSCCGITIVPMQVRSELEGLLQIVPERPRAVLEIGTAGGGTLFSLVQAAAPDAVIVSVDLPEGQFGGGYPRWREPVYRAFVSQRQHLALIRADSHRAQTYDAVTSALGGRELDLLMIDGDHTHEGVKEDFETYTRLVAPGGVVALHDIVPAAPPQPGGPNLLVGGVPTFWKEVRDRYVTTELVEDWEQDGYGIGLMSWPPQPVRAAG